MVGAQVLARSFGRGPTWLEGTLKSISGPSSFVVELEDGRSIRRHFDHILHRGEGQERRNQENENDISDNGTPLPPAIDVTNEGDDEGYEPNLRRSTRIRNHPNRYKPEEP